MTKKELGEIYYINKEIEMWKRELEEVRSPGLGELSFDGMPKGSAKSKDEVGERAVRAIEIEEIIKALIIKLEDKQKRIYEFISTIDNSMMRQIIMYKYLSLYTWDEVAARIGGGNSAQSVRKACERYLDKA